MEADNKNNVHKVLAHSYSVYFFLFLIGVLLDLIFQFRILKSSVIVLAGVVFLILATFLIIWAQKTSRNLKKENISKETFCRGPYRYTRSPTHWGLFLLLLGFAVIANALFVVLATILSFIISKFFFLQKQEQILAKKYGAPYLEYKKIVKF